MKLATLGSVTRQETQFMGALVPVAQLYKEDQKEVGWKRSRAVCIRVERSVVVWTPPDG